MSSDYREGYQVGLKDGKRLGVEEYKKELADSLKNAMPQPLVVVDDIPSLRDQFAMAAMQGVLASDINDEYDSLDRVAETAYCMADAMLAERTKRG